MQRAQKGHPSGRPVSCGSGRALLPAPGALGEVCWPRPVPPRRQEPDPGDSGDPARSIVRDRGATTLSQLRSLPTSLQEGLQRKKKVIWKKAKRAGGVESAGFKEGGTEKEAHPPVLSTAAIPPHRRPFRPRSLPRGARQLCPAPPQRGAPKVTGYLSAQEKFRLPNPSRLTLLTL